MNRVRDLLLRSNWAYGVPAVLPAVLTLSPITLKRPSYPANQLGRSGSLWAVPLLFLIVKSLSMQEATPPSCDV
ncbi:hypothetical protein BDQ94DRAFT_133182 [Aspergillus welwitschiae]|uniref:Uncharacterized protein n=1 Tax=Aspergillus welwitschiae TaxID=1341132 RepID=A0A3F3QJM6_9EURO|nr:hypothetical protein BDQ94DRAFT_133182 [Aspergillus welwitschiae]RDH39493.1 hypothetical protein BDQ94DRAFT_133182 [Aspergillus welwitschiae]